jgi:hypothetical protein
MPMVRGGGDLIPRRDSLLDSLLPVVVATYYLALLAG